VPVHGWRIAPAHFAERHGLVVLIALGESVVAIGVGAGLKLTASVIGGAALGMVVVSALWWLYFDVAAIFARDALVRARGVARVKLARDAYSYLHLPMVAGIVFFAFDSRPPFMTLRRRSRRWRPWRCAQARRCISSRTSPSFGARRGGSSGGGRSGQ